MPPPRCHARSRLSSSHLAPLLPFRHPLALMLPATLAGSFSFISPIGTPANAIAYSMGHLTMQELASVGSVLTVMSVIVLSAMFPSLFVSFIDAMHVPSWAQNGC
jgi:di/tricarboxylate transporter